MRALGSLLILAAATALLRGQVDPAFVERTLPCADGAFAVTRYRLLKPPAIEPGKRYPLVVFLHGAGERGDDNASQLRHMPERMITPAYRERFPCFLLAVQCPKRQRWVEIDWQARESTPMTPKPSPAMAAVLAALEETLRTEPVDRDRLYLTGLSMGGFGTWDLAQRYPHWWAAVAPVCGGGDERLAARLRDLPIFAVHDVGDNAVPVERTRTMIAALEAVGGRPRYEETTGYGHPSWNWAYGEDGLLAWMFEQRRRPIAGPWIPWPRSVTLGTGRWTPAAGARIVATDATLAPLARILQSEVHRASGRRFEIGERASAGDLVLALDPELAPGNYRLDIAVAEGAAVTGHDYEAVALGSVTLLQTLATDRELPECTIEDASDAAWRGLMIDCARHPQSIDTLEEVIELSRFYKLRYVHLHLTDDQAFTFPSQAYPTAATAGHSYTRGELEALEQFARQRGVTLVPEFDVPGHSRALVNARPEVFGLADRKTNGGLIHMGREATYAALDTIVGEMCEVFASSPWFHIGGDEAWLAGIDKDPEAIAYMRAHDLPNAGELYRHFLVRMHEIVERHGKRTLVWEGFHKDGAVPIPDDIVVFAWEAAYQHPRDLLAAGRTVINASWQPLYIVGGGKMAPHAVPRHWSQEHLFGWNARRWEHWAPRYPTFGGFQAGPDDAVLGAHICVWEQLEQSVAETLRPRVAAVAERLWNPDAARSFADFRTRYATCDGILQRLLRPARIGAPEEVDTATVRRGFREPQTVAITATLPGTVRYTLDGSEPTVVSAEYTAPLSIERSTTVRSRLFDASGTPTGHGDWAVFEREGAPRVRYALYRAPRTGWKEMPDFAALQPHARGTLPRLRGGTTSGPLGMVLESRLEIASAGEYELTLKSCDGIAELWIDGELVAAHRKVFDWDGETVTVNLTQGSHDLRILYAQGYFHTLCRVFYKGPGMTDAKLLDELLKLPG